MKEIPQNYTSTLEIIVTDEMTVNFDELGKLHPVYATYQIAKHFEEVGRKVLLPHLEVGEEGIGTAVSVEHLAPALIGMKVILTAVFDRIEGRKLFVKTTATNELGDLIATGTTVQAVLAPEKIESSFAKLQKKWDEWRKNG